jgi:hypothetical protein
MERNDAHHVQQSRASLVRKGWPSKLKPRGSGFRRSLGRRRYGPRAIGKGQQKAKGSNGLGPAHPIMNVTEELEGAEAIRYNVQRVLDHAKDRVH